MHKIFSVLSCSWNYNRSFSLYPQLGSWSDLRRIPSCRLLWFLNCRTTSGNKTCDVKLIFTWWNR